MKGLIIDLGAQVVNWVQTLVDKIGDEANPPEGDETLQRQHKTIEGLLSQITGSYRTADDIIPSEHTLLRHYIPAQKIGSFTNNGFTFNADGYIVGLNENTVVVYNQNTFDIISSPITLNADGATVTGAGVNRKIIRYGSNYAVITHRVSRSISGGVVTFTEEANWIHLYNSAFEFVNKIEWNAGVYGGIKGITWNPDASRFLVITYKPAVHEGVQYGFLDYLCEMDDQGTVDSETAIPGGHLAFAAPMLNNQSILMSMFYSNGRLFYPKQWGVYPSGSIHSINIDSNLGQLARILLFSDAGAKYHGYYPNQSIADITYYGGFLYLRSTDGFIARTRIND